MDGEYTYVDKKAGFFFIGEDYNFDDSHISEIYEVTGEILHKFSHTLFKFKKEFLSLEESNNFFDEIRKEFPLSKIDTFKKTRQAIRCYG